jgi:alpha-1,2-mannosyltransferase
MLTSANIDRLTRRERIILAILVAILPLFGALVVWRSCYMARRHTDFGVYARAAWAARTGHDIYEVTDDSGLHYCYPPTFAVLMAPFAEPPKGEQQQYYLPFGISVGIWFALSVGFAFAAAHILASAVESTCNGTIDRRRWWGLRVWPVLLTLPALGNNLSHGQVNSLLLMLVAGAIAALVRGRSRAAGAWLAGAIALKVIPGFLTLIPLMRRDRRCFSGLTLGLVVLLIGVPAFAWGPTGIWRANLKFVDVMIHPAVGDASQADRSEEMFNILKTDNQSIQAMFHAWQHWGDANAPAEPATHTRAAHWLIGIALTLTTLFVGRRQLAGSELLLFAGALTTVMLFVSPMCHLHYYVLTMPLVTGLLFRAWNSGQDVRFTRQLPVLLGLHVVGGVIPLVFESYRNLGFAPLTTIPLWAFAVNELRRPLATTIAPSVIERKAA